MDIYYVIGLEGVSDGVENPPTCMLRRQEALSRSKEAAIGRIARQGVISLVRMGVASHL